MCQFWLVKSKEVVQMSALLFKFGIAGYNWGRARAVATAEWCKA